MKYKRLHIFVFIGLMVVSLLVPASIALAPKLSSGVATRQSPASASAFFFAPNIFVDSSSTTDSNSHSIEDAVTPLPANTLMLANAAPTNAAPTNAAPTNAAPTNAAPTNAAPTNAAPTNAAPTNAAPTQPNWSFPCSDIQAPTGLLQPNERIISGDWLSGDVPVVTQDVTIRGGGRLFYTYSTDTNELSQVTVLFRPMQGLGFFLIMPSIMLLGYQFMLGASTFRYAGALEGLSRVILGAVAVAVSYQLIDMLISVQNSFIAAIIALHGEHPFPVSTVNGKLIPYRLVGESATSYRGIVMPMSRWGCAVNDFIGVVSQSFLTNTLGSIIPLIGGLAPLAGRVTTIPNLIQRCGELILAIMSFLLWVQVFVRIVLLNYYILMAPVAFGCWALPGGVGQRVVLLWFKGFFTVLFVQVFQLFILTTLPLILPPMPPVDADGIGIMQSVLVQFPLFLTLYAVLVTPRLLGASVGQALGTAGSVAGTTIVAASLVASRAE
jgi:hypothetical protein